MLLLEAIWDMLNFFEEYLIEILVSGIITHSIGAIVTIFIKMWLEQRNAIPVRNDIARITGVWTGKARQNFKEEMVELDVISTIRYSRRKIYGNAILESQ